MHHPSLVRWDADEPYRWRPLEAALAAVGSQHEDVLDAIDDKIDSGRGKPIDIESLLANVIPNFLVLSRTSILHP